VTIKLVGFGQGINFAPVFIYVLGFFYKDLVSDERPNILKRPEYEHVPELILGCPWDQRIDIWSAGELVVSLPFWLTQVV
jgi:hypothetical protein